MCLFYDSVGQLLQWIIKGQKLLVPKAYETNDNIISFPAVDFCLPSSCSPEDIRRAISEFVGQEVIFTYKDDLNKTHRYSIATFVGDDWCSTRESVNATPNFDGADIAVM